MKQPGYTLQKIIAICFIIWGAGILAYGIYAWLAIFKMINLSWHDFSPWYFLKKNHSSFIGPILSLIAGILLLTRNRIGWISGICVSISIPLGYLINHRFYEEMHKTNATGLFVISGISLLFLFAFISLVSNPIRSAYRPNKFSWIAIIIIFVLIMADQLVAQHFETIDNNEIINEMSKHNALDSIPESKTDTGSIKK
jgi:magnesium-transporting ATPase (P-type)